MENERMREEIRQEMEMERLAIKEEVRRELIMEQYALQRAAGLSLQSSQQHLMDFVVSPQPMIRARAEETALGVNMPLLLNRASRWTEPVSCGAPQKQKLVILESKAGEENKTTRKRKALSPPPQAAEEIDVPLVEIAKKTKENRFYCEVCRVSSNSKLALQDHLGGRKHKSKEADLSAKKKEAAEENLRFPFRCHACKVGAHSKDVMLRHESGKKHVNCLSRPESKFSVMVNDLAGWVDAYEKEDITDKLVVKAERGEHKVVEDKLEGIYMSFLPLIWNIVLTTFCIIS